MSERPTIRHQEELDADVILVGGGIMSATLGSMLAVLQPKWRIILLDKANNLASESSGPWNNAGTGHSGFCELNYMPDPTDGRMAATVARQFNLSLQWWAYLARRGLLDPTSFIHTTPHMDLVFGDDVEYLRQRFDTLSGEALFHGLEYSDDPETIAAWAPLTIQGRDPSERVAATRHPHGTDVDFGALTMGLTRILSGSAGEVRLGHEVTGLRRTSAGSWIVRGKFGSHGFTLRSKHVFVGAGGMALRLLQRARLPEVRGYAVLPVGAAFFRCSATDVVSRHNAKVYGRADIGAPPMSVPHLDKRVIDGTGHLMFGPYATFSTKLLKNGQLTDFFTTLRWHNLHVIAAALVQNLPLMRYLIGELNARPQKKFTKLRRFYPLADADQWELVQAGQRAQLVTPDRRRVGVIQQGTELIVGGNGSITGLLGASPGASTAVPIMLDLLERCFPDEWRTSWSRLVSEALPSYAAPGRRDAAVIDSHTAIASALQLDIEPNQR